MAKIESFQVEASVVGSFLNARYGNTLPDQLAVAYYGTAGSVVVVVQR